MTIHVKPSGAALGAEIVGAVPRPLAVLGLGGTVSTPPGGIEGELLVVSNFDDLRDRAASVRGRINVPSSYVRV